MVERLNGIQEVRGSTPLISTMVEGFLKSLYDMSKSEPAARSDFYFLAARKDAYCTVE